MPISVKGVILANDAVVLLKNERNEWELPGGRLESGELHTACCARELSEELGIAATVIELIDTWVYNIGSSCVQIVTYACLVESSQLSETRLSHEHKALGVFPLLSLGDLVIPDGYVRSIKTWAKQWRRM